MEYAIYEGFYPEVEKKLRRIERKCAAHNCAFHFEVKGEEIRDCYPVDEHGVEITHLPPYKCKFILIEVEGTARVDNWECIAVMEHTASGNIIRKINTEMEVPERFYHSDDVCEHCGVRRMRKELFIIHNVKTDEWRQVGKSCLKLYTNGLSAEAVAAYLDGIRFLESKVSEDFSEFVNTGKWVDVKDVIGRAVEVIAAFGRYVKSDEYGRSSTKDMVSVMVMREELSWKIAYMNDHFKDNRSGQYFSREQFYLDSTPEKVEKIIAYYKGLSDGGEFIHNIQTMLAEGYVQRKHIGFLCYLPVGYEKAMQKENERKQREAQIATVEFYGEVGKRYTRKVDSAMIVTSWETQYGWTNLYRIVCGNNVLVWKTSKNIFADAEGKALDEITFTVKEHKEYRGENQTEVTRCKVTFTEVKTPEEKPEGTFSLDVLDDLDED